MWKIARTALAVVLFGATLEVSARVDDFLRYRAPLTGQYTASILRAQDAEGININIPDSRFEKYSNNSVGFRGPELEALAPAGTERIVCLGASETYGLYESEDREWPAQLRTILAEDVQTEIINAASAGLAFRDYLRYFDKYVAGYRPETAVILMSPHAFVGGQIRAAHKANAAEDGEVRSEGNRPGPAAGGPASRLLPKAKTLAKMLMPEKLKSSLQLGKAEAAMADAKLQFLAGRQPMDEVPDEIIVQYEQTLRELVKSLQDRDIEVILTIYPTLLDEENISEHPYLSVETLRYFVELSFEGFLDAGRQCADVTRRVSGELGTGLIDLDAEIPDSSRYFADNVHYTDSGARMVAEAVAEHLLGRSSH